MTSNDPDQIRRQIERTRDALSEDVNALSEKVTPSRIVDRRVQAAKGGVASVRDKIMGASDRGGKASDAVSGMRDSASDAVSSIGGVVSSAPTTVRERTQGNPLAVGLIAFGVGWLASSLLPASDVEQQAASQLHDRAQPLTDQAQQAVTDVVRNLQEPAQQAVEQVKSTASDAADTVKGHASSAASDLKAQATP